MAIVMNAKGTTSPYFKIGKQGTNVFQGSSDPASSYTTAEGDMWVDTSNKITKFRNSGNDGWTQGSLDVTGNITVSGNLTINGTTTTLDTTNLLIEDPLMVLARNVSGTPTYDAGIVVERGDSTNVGLIWDESADTFAVVNTTETGGTAGNVSIASYADLKAGTLSITGTVGIDGGITHTASAGGHIAFNSGAADSDFRIASVNNTHIFATDAANNRVGIGTGSPAATLDVTGTDAIIIPSGTTAQRPTGEAGMMRFNSTTSRFEGYNGSAWVNIDTLYS